MMLDEQRDQRLAALPVRRVETGGARAVEIEHPNDFTILDQRHDQLRARIRIAGDMAGKRIDIRRPARLSPRAAAVPHTPSPIAMRTQAGLPWNGPSTSASPWRK